MLQKLIKEPLVQFLALGSTFYFILYLFGSTISPLSLGGGPKEIIVNDEILVEYFQFQRKSFNPEKAKQLLSMMSKGAKSQLEASYIRDEVLYREAMALALDTNDEIIRRRMIQKMEYLAQGFYDDLPEISEDQLSQFFIENQSQYLIEATVTFTHIFFGSLEPTSETAESRALQQLVILKEQKPAFEDAGKFGERFLYNRNYIDRSASFIESHFDTDFQQALFLLNTSTDWQGPLKSIYGYHLVQVVKNTSARMPSLDEVANIVLGDARQAKQRALKSEAIDKLIEQYSISYPASNP